jgi:integrase
LGLVGRDCHAIWKDELLVRRRNSVVKPSSLTDEPVIAANAGLLLLTVNSLASQRFSLAIRDGKASLNPCRQVKNFEAHNERIRYLLPEEGQRLLCVVGVEVASSADRSVGDQYRMRQGEILAMRWDWIDLPRGFIYIPGEVSKTGKPRSVPMNTVVRSLLKQLQSSRGRSDVVFLSPKTGKLLTDIKHGFVAACDDAGLADFHFHDLRHTAATRLADSGADPFVIGNPRTFRLADDEEVHSCN